MVREREFMIECGPWGKGTRTEAFGNAQGTIEEKTGRSQ